MTNDELLAKINQELEGDYQIGFHNLTMESYIFKSRFNKEKYCMDPGLLMKMILFLVY